MVQPRPVSKDGPLVTIVTPSLNQGNLIRATIESVLRQDYPYLEYVIRDGGSTDETPRVAAEYAGRLSFVTERDRGQSDAINKGFRQAKGSIVAWLNSDDTLLPGAVRKAVDALERCTEAGAVYGDGYLIDREGVVVSRFPFTRPPDLWRLVHLSDYILQQAVFFRKEALHAVGYLNEALHWTMDWDVLIRLGLRYPLVHLPESLGCLRVHRGTKTASGGWRRILEIRAMLGRHGAGQVPPACLAYGLGALGDAIDRPLAAMQPRALRRTGEALRKAVGRKTSWASWKLTGDHQGLWEDGWAGPAAHFILPPGSGRLLIDGTVPGGLPSPGGQELRLTVEGRDCGAHSLGPGDFRLEVPLPPGVPETAATVTIRTGRFFVPSRFGGGSERRRLAYQVRSIRREREGAPAGLPAAGNEAPEPVGLPGGAHVLVVHMGGLGDIVLASELVGGLKRHPGGLSVTLVCRAGVAGATALFPVPPDRVIRVGFDPHAWVVPSPELFAALEPAVRELKLHPAHLVVDATLRPTWLGDLAAAVAGEGPLLACGDARGPGPILEELLARLGLARPERTGPALGPSLHERDRYRLLLGALGLAPGLQFPWRRAAAGAAEAKSFLRGAGIAEGSYVACFPAGAPSTVVKRWPVERYVETLRDLQERRRLPVVLVGQSSEREELDRIATALEARVAPSAVFAGTADEIPVLAALLADARLYIGNDTGPLHLASAYGTPGVAIYGGGGRWPSYAPWAAGSIGLHHPLPCYGCDWDCFLGHALCIESVPVQAVLYAVDELLAGSHGPPESRPLDLLRESVTRVAGDASARYRESQSDRAARLAVILELSRTERAASEAARARQTRIEELERALAGMPAEGPGPAPIRAFQIPTGLGAGNIGDELMARAFWGHLPPHVGLDVALFGESVRQHEAYPGRHRTRPVDWHGNETAWASGIPGLLVGGTPVAEAEGLEFPLRFLAPRLARFHETGQPVDAVGVGVDRLLLPEAVELFRRAFLPVRSWTVRSPSCREALLELGVDSARVRVGADWAWLHRPSRDLSAWAAGRWRALGVADGEPLLVANAVSLIWRDAPGRREEMAAALDLVASELGLRIAFFCNECREGPLYDHASALEIAGIMRAPAVVVPNEYFSPDEAVALLARATVTAGARYHFVVESVLAGTVPVAIGRGQKMEGLVAELEIPAGGPIARLRRDELFRAIRRALVERSGLLSRLAERREALAERAGQNLSFLRELSPYHLDAAGPRDAGARRPEVP